MGKPCLSAAALALALSTGAAHAEDTSGCKLVKIGEIPIKFEHNRALMQVQINGKSAWLIIDTGSEATSLFGGAARELGLNMVNLNNRQAYGIGGGQEVKYTVVPELTFAGAKVKDVQFEVIGHGGSMNSAGLIGRDFLGQMGDLEFDFNASVIRRWSAKNCGNRSLAYWSKDAQWIDMRHDDPTDIYAVRLTVNGKPVTAEIDSGAFTTVATPEVANLAGVKQENYEKEVSRTTGIGEGSVESRIATFDVIGIGDEQVKHPRLRIADMFAATKETSTGSMLEHRVDLGVDEPKMLLGADFLRSHHVMFAASQRRMYFSYNGGPVFEAVGGAVKPQPSSDEAAPLPPAAAPNP